MSSYRTYEEWKHDMNESQEQEQGFVLTVPMRNGNHDRKNRIQDEHQVLTVPMRNGNRLF